MAELIRVPFSVPLRVPVGDVTQRSGELIGGPAGWGEFSPLPSWSAEQVALAERSAVEAATERFPDPLRMTIDVNAMIPRVPPSVAAEMARATDCGTIKVKVGDAQGQVRVEAVRAARPDARIRLDANGAWDALSASIALGTLSDLDIEFCEDPVADIATLAMLRKGSNVLIAIESAIRSLDDVDAAREAKAADILVIKPQRLGGAAASLEAARRWGGPVVASSALETSVGLSLVAAVAAALPVAPFAHGVGTAALLASDVTDAPLVSRGGVMQPRRVEPR